MESDDMMLPLRAAQCAKCRGAQFVYNMLDTQSTQCCYITEITGWRPETKKDQDYFFDGFYTLFTACTDTACLYLLSQSEITGCWPETIKLDFFFGRIIFHGCYQYKARG